MSALLSESLYGREKELDSIVSVWQMVKAGQGATVLVSGGAGTGKTLLVRQLLTSGQYASPLFFHAKADQLQLNRPYVLFSDIIREFVSRQAQSSFTRKYWAARLSRLSEKYRRSLVSLIPELSSLVMDVASTSQSEFETELVNSTENALLAFMQCVCSTGEPICIFLDDVQWADSASLQLLQKLIELNMPGCLLLICYRDADLDLMARIDIDTASIPVHEIRLTDFSPDLMERWVAGILGETGKHADNIARYIHNITGGNPFYSARVFEKLKAQGYVGMETDAKNSWQPPAHPDGKKGDVLDFLAEDLLGLPEDILITIQMAACLGNKVRLDMLALVLNQDVESVASLLACYEGKLYSLRDDALIFQHDHCQLAVLHTLAPRQLKLAHLKIARSLSRRSARPMLPDNVFLSLRHWNAALDVLDEDDRYPVALLNIEASKRAMSANAYDTAVEYILIAVRIMTDAAGFFSDAEIFSAYFMQARAEYLAGSKELAFRHVIELFPLCSSLQDIADYYRLYKDIMITQGREYNEVLNIGLRLLVERGLLNKVQLSDLQGLTLDLARKIEATSFYLDAEYILRLPRIVEGDSRVILQLLMDVWEVAYYAGQEDLLDLCTMLMVSQSFVNGNCTESAFAYVSYSVWLVNRQQYELANQFGKLAVELNAEFNDRIMLPKVTNIYCNWVSYFRHPFSYNASLYKRSAETGQENGDHLFGLWATLFYPWSTFLAGQRLREVGEIIDGNREFVKQTGDQKVLWAYQILDDVIGYLAHKDSDLEAAHKNVTRAIALWDNESFLPGKTWYATLSAQAAFLVGDYDQVVKVVEQFAVEQNPAFIMFPVSQLNFYYSLASLRLNSQVPQQLDIARIKRIQRQLRDWALHCEDNFGVYALLLQAAIYEYEQAAGDKVESCLDTALEIAVRYGHPVHKGLVFESLFLYWRGKQSPGMARHFLQLAYMEYSSWGAVRVSQSMLDRHADWLDASVLIEFSSEQNAIAADVQLSPLKTLDELELFANLTRRISQAKDTGSLFQLLIFSGMTLLPAEHGALVIQEGGQAQVYSFVDPDEGSAHNPVPSGMDASSQICQSVVNDCLRQARPVYISDSHSDGLFGLDPYFKSREARFVCCLPVLQGDTVLGALYLDSSIPRQEVSKNRSEVLDLLMRHAVSALEALRARSRFEEQERSYRAMIGNLPGAVCQRSRLNIQSLEFVSNAIEDITGYSPQSLIEEVDGGYHSLIFTADRERVLDQLRSAISQGVSYTLEYRIQDREGSLHWVEENGQAVLQDGRLDKLVGTIFDQTEKKQAEQEREGLQRQLQQSQKMEAIGQLTGGIAHDFNNMLGAILGYSELISQIATEDQNPKILQYIEQVQSSGNRAAELVTQMLTFSRHTDSRKTPCNLATVIDQSMNMLRFSLASSIRLEVDLNAHDQMVLANEVQLNQVILNLCINARDAMDGQGVILVSLYKMDIVRTICSSCHQSVSGEYLELMVRDTGTGMPPEVIKKVFDPFFTTKEVGKGTGMGLSMVHGIVHAHDGHIRLVSAPGQGAEFRIYLPVYRPE